MAETTLADFKIYEPQFQSALVETLQQAADVFNGASANTIRLYPMAMAGQYDYNAFFEVVSGLVRRRDPSAVTDATDLQMTQDEQISVKVNRGLGPVLFTNDAFKKIGRDPELASFVIGQQAASAMQIDYLNTGLLGLVAALGTQSSLIHDGTSGTLTHNALVSGLSKFGDRASRIRAWVMHSKPFYDLVGQAITDKITNVADVTIYGGGPGTLGKPVIVTDSAALINTTPSPDNYHVLGLAEGALDLIQSETTDVVNDLVTGKENIMQRIQGEHAYNVKIKGVKWDVANGGVNPDDSTIGTGTNWDSIVADVKDFAGVMINVQ